MWLNYFLDFLSFPTPRHRYVCQSFHYTIPIYNNFIFLIIILHYFMTVQRIYIIYLGTINKRAIPKVVYLINVLLYFFIFTITVWFSEKPSSGFFKYRIIIKIYTRTWSRINYHNSMKKYLHKIYCSLLKVSLKNRVPTFKIQFI